MQLTEKELRKIKSVCRSLRAGRTVLNREAVLRLSRPSDTDSDQYREYHQFLLDNNSNREDIEEAINAIELEVG